MCGTFLPLLWVQVCLTLFFWLAQRRAGEPQRCVSEVVWATRRKLANEPVLILGPQPEQAAPRLFAVMWTSVLLSSR